jgi:cystathionine beta-lyase
MDFGLAPAISTALHRAIDDGLTAYPSDVLEQDSVEAAVGFWNDRFGWSVGQGSVAQAPDVMTGLSRAVQHLTPDGSPVVVPSPMYYPFYGRIRGVGREVLEVPTTPDYQGRFTLDLDGIDRALSKGAGSIALCNPWNPTGRALTDNELGDLVELATSRDVLIISDEIHSPIVYSGRRHIPIATLAPDRVVTITAASKAWNLPGLKCAQVILTNPSHSEIWGSYFTPEKVGVGILGLVATTAAYRDGVEWFDDVLVELERNRDLLSALLAERLPEAGYSEPEGTYLAWVDMSRYGLSDPTAELLETARVAVTGGAPFGVDGSQWIRINFATSPGVIEQVVDRIATHVGS